MIYQKELKSKNILIQFCYDGYMGFLMTMTLGYIRFLDDTKYSSVKESKN